MKLRYDGPGAQINVEPYGPHRRGEVKRYPDLFAAELLATSRRNLFAAVDAPEAKSAPERRRRKAGHTEG